MRFYHISRKLPDQKLVDKKFLNIKLLNKKDCILIMSVLFAAGAASLAAALVMGSTGQEIRITVDGKLFGEYSLSENQTIVIDGPYGYNRIVIENGTAYMDEADCPDKYCMEYKPVAKGNETIVCLPHRLVVEVVGKADGQQPDIVVQ